LQEGINVVVIKGIDAGGVAGLLADMARDGSTAVTDTSWKVRYSLPAHYADCRIMPTNWDKSGVLLTTLQFKSA
jgi:hypothetical protein